MSSGDKGAAVVSGAGEEVGDGSAPSSAGGEVTMALGVEEAVGSGSWHRSSTIVGSGSVHKMFGDSSPGATLFKFELLGSGARTLGVGPSKRNATVSRTCSSIPRPKSTSPSIGAAEPTIAEHEASRIIGSHLSCGSDTGSEFKLSSNSCTYRAQTWLGVQ
jgi:hypothetical protein